MHSRAAWVPSSEWSQAMLSVEVLLRELTDVPPLRLDASEIQHLYPRREFVAGWRFSIEFSDKSLRRIDVLATAFFPQVSVRTALVDRPAYLTWPHIEHDGVLCLLPNMAEVDPEHPGKVAQNLLTKSSRLVEELIHGAIVERDFKEEFLTYWFYNANTDKRYIHSLLNLRGPSRAVVMWRGEDIIVVGETPEQLQSWVVNRFGRTSSFQHEPIKGAAFLWLEEPLLPTDHPKTASDLMKIAGAVGGEARDILAGIIGQQSSDLVVLLGARGRHGAGVVGVTIPPSAPRPANDRYVRDRRTKGFRPGRVPAAMLQQRTFNSTPVYRSVVQRADPAWIHGRGQDARSELLLKSTVTMIGCGSVGAPVAAILAQSGVGTLYLVDFDELEWANVGRHPLGATAVGKNKATALAHRLSADYPHLKIIGYPMGVQGLIEDFSDILQASDLVISATGSWAADYALNQWHLAQGREKPILYGWTESYACAGHAVCISTAGGCLQCGLETTGTPNLRVTSFPTDSVKEEPACGNHYQPYGAAELSYITALVADTAVECLISPTKESSHRVWTASTSRLQAAGGDWSPQWKTLAPTLLDGGVLFKQPWQMKEGCRVCSQ